MAAAGDAGHAPQSVADATHELYRQYGKQIYAYCLHQLRSREEAEDAVQTTFLNAFRGLQRGTTTRFEQAWLYKIAQNVCIARRSSSGRRLKLEAPDDFDILEEIVPSAHSAGEGDTLELMGLDDALDSMPENQRRAILLREWQGLSYREIADELGLSQGAVEMLIFRARRTLATALEQPDVAAKRRTSRAKTGFSFGSVVAAMKSLFSTSAGIKMAAVAATTAAVIGTNVVHSVVKPFIPAKHPAPKTHAVAPAVQTAVVPASPASITSGSAIVRAIRQASTASSVALGSAGGGRADHKPVIPETASGAGGAAPATGSVPATTAGATPSNESTSSSTAPAVTLTPGSSTAPTKHGTTHRSVSPSNGAHHSGAAMPAPTSLGTPGDTTTPHQHGPASVGPTNASTGQSSSDASSDTSGGSGPVSLTGGPVGYSTGATQGTTTGNTPRGGTTTTSGGGDTSSQGDGSAPDQGGGSSSSSSPGTSSSSGDTTTTSSGDNGSDSSSSSSSDSQGADQGRGNGHGSWSGNGDGNGNGGGHDHGGHHGNGRSIQNAG